MRLLWDKNDQIRNWPLYFPDMRSTPGTLSEQMRESRALRRPQSLLRKKGSPLRKCVKSRAVKRGFEWVQTQASFEDIKRDIELSRGPETTKVSWMPFAKRSFDKYGIPNCSSTKGRLAMKYLKWEWSYSKV